MIVKSSFDSFDGAKLRKKNMHFDTLHGKSGRWRPPTFSNTLFLSHLCFYAIRKRVDDI